MGGARVPESKTELCIQWHLGNFTGRLASYFMGSHTLDMSAQEGTEEANTLKRLIGRFLGSFSDIQWHTRGS